MEHAKDDLGYKIDITSYDGTTDALGDVVSGRLDASVQDECAALYYVNRDPKLALVGWPINAGYYVVLINPGETRLLAAIDQGAGPNSFRWPLAISVRQMGNRRPAQMLLLRKESDTPAAPTSSFWQVLVTNLPVLLQAAWMTIFLSVVSFPLAVVIGIGVAIGRLYGPWIIAKPLGFYVEVLRGTPLMLQLFAIFYLLPKIGLELPPIVAAITGLAINYSAYESEIYRAGLQAVARGQVEAALALGMTAAWPSVASSYRKRSASLFRRSRTTSSRCSKTRRSVQSSPLWN